MERVERIVKKWYEGLEEGKLLGRRCPECGHIEFPPHYACNECGHLDTEWCEISGKAYATCFIPQSMMQNNPGLTEEYGDFMWAIVQIEEGDILDGMNTVVLKVGEDRLEELNAKLPVPVKPCIVQRDGYKMLFWELDE
ncbi:hypothetical protein GCM10008910_21180 [Faecalicatena orotica]|uniref:Putative OB-fold protein n=1 Tax=Faecalicatena orotica TaxID=1544 RepID=A0A2Y9B9A3_9FIRM|nr:zinc ribbon domain-containing protein [Faecalicatena orotica]PWJ32346.1 putative OB-fold protein [Faecalicatena orotica]SSA54180.1 Uncharacterized OB-fold protein, contains Zn-ribbon domain [Faecalicatena orotica]